MEELEEYSEGYIGGAFHVRFTGGKAVGLLSITEDSLNFFTLTPSESSSAILPIDGLRVKTGGAGGNMIFISHPSLPDWTIYTSDQDILNDPILTSDAEIASQISVIRLAKKKSNLFIIMFLIITAGLIYSIFSLKETVCETLAKQIPVSWENQFGSTILYQFTTSNKMIENPKLSEMMNKIADPILKAIPDKRFDISIYISDDPQINAFALPGGHIVFYSGLLLAARSPEEIAGVLAHETAHVTRQHGIRHLIGTAGIFIMAKALFGDIEGLLGLIINQGTFLINQKYSRDYEREADDAGWDYLVNANVDPRGMLSFFETLKAHKKKSGQDTVEKISDTLSYLSTHPATAERIERLNEKLNQYEHDFPKAYEKLDFSPKEFMSQASEK